MTFKKATILVLIMGIGIIAIGFIYDVFFAGIPYQDPSPALQKQFEFHSAIASYLHISGGIVIGFSPAIGLIWSKLSSEKPTVHNGAG